MELLLATFIIGFAVYIGYRKGVSDVEANSHAIIDDTICNLIQNGYLGVILNDEGEEEMLKFGEKENGETTDKET